LWRDVRARPFGRAKQSPRDVAARMRAVRDDLRAKGLTRARPTGGGSTGAEGRGARARARNPSEKPACGPAGLGQPAPPPGSHQVTARTLWPPPGSPCSLRTPAIPLLVSPPLGVESATLLEALGTVVLASSPSCSRSAQQRRVIQSSVKHWRPSARGRGRGS